MSTGQKKSKDRKITLFVVHKTRAAVRVAISSRIPLAAQTLAGVGQLAG
jgi:hypothetical protein